MPTLDERVTTLENYFKIGLAVAAIVGVSGGFIGKTAYDALAAATKAQESAAAAKSEVEHARDEAVKTVTESGRQAVLAAVQSEVPAAVKTEFNRLSAGIQLKFGQDQFLDYQPMNKSFDHKCQPGSVAVGWGFGHLHQDVSFFCRRLEVTVSEK